ncbi:MAG TPA: peptidase M50 [Mycobacterium sp.]|nr:peptidase M50 [Mycobacterium sp.]
MQPVTYTIRPFAQESALTADVAVLRFGDRAVPRSLRSLPVIDTDCAGNYRRVIVVGSKTDLAAVLTQLLRAEMVDVEIGFVTGRRGARRALSGTARRVPLIRDDTGHVIVGAATWQGADGPLHGEAVVDDTTLFDGEVFSVRIEPTGALPGLRAAVLTNRGRPQRWVAGRAAQLGTTGARVTRDGVADGRTVKRSTFYRNVKGWLRVE